MTIAESREKCKGFIARVPRDILIVAVLISASSASFGLGYLAGSTSSPQAEIDSSVSQAGQGTEGIILDSSSQETSTTEKVVASKNGTKYYFSSCSGASRISDANKVWFVSASAAVAAGYTLASNCKGN